MTLAYLVSSRAMRNRFHTTQGRVMCCMLSTLTLQASSDYASGILRPLLLTMHAVVKLCVYASGQLIWPSCACAGCTGTPHSLLDHSTQFTIAIRRLRPGAGGHATQDEHAVIPLHRTVSWAGLCHLGDTAMDGPAPAACSQCGRGGLSSTTAATCIF